MNYVSLRKCIKEVEDYGFFIYFFLFLVILMLLFLFYDLKVVSCYFFLLLQVIYIGIYFLRGENGDTMNLYIYTEDCPLHRR